MNFRVVIPARLGSTRLPEKMLRQIHGRPLVQYTWEAARRSGAEEVVIATDDARVESACRTFGADVAMTSARHPSGSDRINEVAQARGWADDGVIVNLQGDEPLMPPEFLRRAAELLDGDRGAEIATLCHPIRTPEEWRSPNVVKVVMDQGGRALYFSRAPVPWRRDGSTLGEPVFPEGAAFRHIGLYAYRAAALARFSSLTPSPLERVEALEQLRALENGMVIRVGVVEESPPRGVDTEDDLAAVSRALAN